MPKVLVTEPLAPEGLETLKRYAQVDIRFRLKPLELVQLIGDYEGLIVRSETKVTAQVIEAGKKLLVIGRAGVGVDNVDVEAATHHGVTVVNAPTGNTIAAAEHTLALMLALARHIPQAHSLLREGVWRRSDFMGMELKSKTLGILGLGNVGTAVAQRAQGFEMKVIAFDPYVSPDYARHLRIESASLEELLRTSDFISVHLPLNESTRGFLGEKELALVKPSVRIINTARGGLIDEEALYRALEEGRVAGAAVDVFTVEPPEDNILFKSNKVIVTPHIAGSTNEAQAAVATDISEQVIAVLQGQPARYVVNAPLIPPEQLSFLGPFICVAQTVGKLAAQLAEGQILAIQLKYEGEVGQYDTAVLKAGVLSGLLERITEERVTLVNAHLIAQRRGFRIVELKGEVSEVYPSLITVELTTSQGSTVAAGTLFRSQAHIVRVNQFWLDIVPTGGYFLFCDHTDRPGLIGAVGTITGKANINIHTMHLGRLEPRGQALMVLGLDEAVTEEHRRQILAIPSIHTAKLVKL